MNRKESATRAFEAVEQGLGDILEWMYEHPETAYQETETSARLASFLGENGFAVDYPAYGLATAFEANAGTSGPRVVICAEYDALPQVGHACGHNIIATSSLGAGIAVAGMTDELGIRLTVLGTPAEEAGGGKIELLRGGAFDDAAASMLIHPSIRDIADPRVLAAQTFTATYTGKEAHAAGSPHRGVNALDAFVQAYNNVSTLRQQFEPGERVHGIIQEGGVAANIIPARTVSTWIVRAETSAGFERLKQRVVSCFEAAALASGCDLDIGFTEEPYLDLVSSEVLVDLFVANAKAIGRDMPTFAESGERTYASTDMGNVSHAVPSIHPSLAIETEAVNHQPEFASATVTPSGRRALRDGALAMAHTIIDMAEMSVWEDL